MFWNRKKPEPRTPAENRLDSLVQRLVQQGKVDSLEAELGHFDPTSLKGPELESWYHLYGIAAFQQGNHALAFERFRNGVRHCPDSGFLHFSLGQEHEFRGEVTEMLECFDKFPFPKVPAKYVLAQARYAYLWGRTDKGWSYIEPLMSAYFSLKVLDGTFLHIRGLPFFEQTWEYLAAFSQLEDDFRRLDELTRRAETECSDLDFDYLKMKLECIRSGNFSGLKDRLRASIQRHRSGDFPGGYQAMQLGILMAQETDDTEEAERLLETVTLAPNDFPWLNDMRLLARCELAHRGGDQAGESKLCAQFIARQPLLFEPDNAVNFNLLRYQENLKFIFRRTRRRNT